jgi:hypothetical protein
MIPGDSVQLDANLAFVQGDTWGGIPSITITPPSTGSTAELAIFAIKKQASDIQTVKQLSSADGDITITDDVNWIFSIPQQNIGLNAGTYVWQFRVTDSDDVIQTYLQGSMQVLQQYSLPS